MLFLLGPLSGILLQAFPKRHFRFFYLREGFFAMAFFGSPPEEGFAPFSEALWPGRKNLESFSSRFLFY
jgi:hypothetical protein